MSVSKKIVIVLLAVILAIAGAVAVYTSDSDNITKLKTGSIINKTTGLDTVIAGGFETDYPLVQTSQKDLFYEPYPDGTIKFFKFENNSFTEQSGIKSTKAALTCSNQKLNVKIYYMNTDAGVIGYGLFTSKQNSDVKLFPYVFLRLMKCPASYKKYAKTDYILLADMDAEDSYKAEKTYSDMYSFDIKNGKASLTLSSRDRVVQEDGTYREDWTIFTDAYLNSISKTALFATSRNYDVVQTAKKYDVFDASKAGSSESKSKVIKMTDSPSNTIIEKDGNYFCFANTDNGFDLVRNGDKKSPIKSFDGKFSSYSVSGKWLFDKKSVEFTDISTGETKSVKNTDLIGFEGFAASPSGNKFSVFLQGSKQSMIVFDTVENKKSVVFDNKIFNSGILNFCFIDDSTLLVTDYNEAGKADNKICKI